jgi:hypothetical protein
MTTFYEKSELLSMLKEVLDKQFYLKVEERMNG